MHIVLYQPEIPANTGNVVRLCAVTGCHLHLVRPLGFSTDDRQLKRAGLDYWHLLDIDYWDDIRDLFEVYKDNPKYFLTSKGLKGYTQVNYDPESLLVFGRETSGLPDWIHEAFPEQCLRIPMIPDPKARCLNLSNAVAVVVYEAFRQQPGFGGLSLEPTFKPVTDCYSMDSFACGFETRGFAPQTVSPRRRISPHGITQSLPTVCSRLYLAA